MLRLRNHLDILGEDEIGEAQAFSNIDAKPRTTLYEAWMEQHFFSDRLRLKFGKIDANTEFAAVQNASDFLNSSMGYSPTIMAFPTYPEPKLGLNAFLHPTRNDALGLGLFQTSTAGTLLIFEPEHAWSPGRRENPGHISVGYWRLGGDVVRFDGRVSRGTNGLYTVVEQTLWRDPETDQRGRKLSAYLQIGTANRQVNLFDRHLGVGTVLQGMWSKRKQDSIGIAATWVRFSLQPLGSPLSAELIFESYYKATITQHLFLVTDFQFAQHPGGLRSHPGCPVLTPRLVASF